MTVMKSPEDFFQAVGRELGSSPVVDELDDQRVVDLEGAGKPGRDANPFVDGLTQRDSIRVEAPPGHELRVKRLNGFGMLHARLQNCRLAGRGRRRRIGLRLCRTILRVRRCNRDECTDPND